MGNKMKNIAISSVALALFSSVSAVQMTAGPDVYGANGSEYSNTDARFDLSQIGIDIYQHGSGDKCSNGDWTTVHWRGALKDGRVVTDSHDEGDGRPKVFALGASEVFKCWDLALLQLKQGDRAKVHCPYYLAYGNAYTWPGVGGEPIPLHSDIDFDIDVVECNKVPDRIQYFGQPVTTTMQPGACMYLHMVASADVEHDLVLSAVDTGSAPLNALVEEKVWYDKSQQWFATADGILSNAAHPDLQLTSIAGGNLGLTAAGTKWYYDPKKSALTTGELSSTEQIYAARPHDDANMQVGLSSIYGDLNTAKFRIEYCKQYFGS